MALKDSLPKDPAMTFTLEYGRGETYRNGKPTLYGHGEYPSYSVLAGQSRRVWVEQWDSREEALKELTECGVEFDDWTDGGGSSHVPVDQIVAHLPDDTDY